MKIWLKADGKRKKSAAAIIETHLVGHGLTVKRSLNIPICDAVVCWGQSGDGCRLPVLNANCNRFNKMTHLQMFIEAGLNAPLVMRDAHKAKPATVYLARNVSHQKGLDIIVCQNQRTLIQAMGDRDFFVEWIPTKTEYRVWVFQNKVLAVYEKQFKGDGEYKGYMRNHRFGFEFVSRNVEGINGMKELGKCSIGAVKAIDLDFGAVDVIRGKDGKFYVLEVNTAPHIDSPDRKSGIMLANEIARWAENV